MDAPNTLGNTKAYDDEQALLAAEHRGYLRGVEDAARIADDERLRCAPNPDGDKWYMDRMLARVTSATFIRDAIRALGAKPHDQ